MITKTKRRISKLIIHCTATPDGRPHTIEQITAWHLKRGFNTIGYHFVIMLDGDVEVGRNIEQIGAHTQGQNTGSIGLCYVGGLDNRLNPKDTRNELQLRSMEAFVKEFIALYPNGEVAGHYAFANKACPSFDVPAWLRSIGVAEKNIYV